MPNFFKGVGGGTEICLFGLIASNRTIIPEICCCDVFWCEEQCVLFDFCNGASNRIWWVELQASCFERVYIVCTRV